MSIKKHTHELDRPVQDRDASAVATAAGPVMSNSGRAAYVQRKRAERAANGGAPGGADIHAAAQRGIAGPVVELPHRDRIQASFGRHDVSGIAAHVGGAARTAADSMGANAYATGSHVSFAEHPDLHTAAHEAAHVVQQRGGVQLSGGVGKAGDAYEQHADAVADKVVAGESAEALLDEHAGDGVARASNAVQRDTTMRDETAASLDDVVMAPSETRFGQVLIGDTSESRTVVLANTGDSDIDIDDIRDAGQPQEVEAVVSSLLPLTLGPGDHIDVDLAFQPKEIGSRHATVHALTEDGRSAASVDVHGVGAYPKQDMDRPTDSMVGQIEASPDQMRFLGTTEVGLSSTDRVFSLTNVSDQPVELDRVAQLGQPAHFDAVFDVATPKALEPGETVALNVSFQPKEPGAHRATLHILLADGTAAGAVKIEGEAVPKSKKTSRKEEDEEIVGNAIPVEFEPWPIEKIGLHIVSQLEAGVGNLAGAFDVWQAYLNAPSTDEAKEGDIVEMAAEAAKDQVFKAILMPLNGVPGGKFVQSLFGAAWSTAKAQAKDSARAASDKEAIKVRDFVVKLSEEITRQKTSVVSKRVNFIDELESAHKAMAEGAQIGYRMQLRDAGNQMQQALDGPASVSAGFTAISDKWIHETEVRGDESYFELVLDRDWTLTKAFLHAPRGDRLAEGLMAQHGGNLNLAAMKQARVKITWFPTEARWPRVDVETRGDGFVDKIEPRGGALTEDDLKTLEDQFVEKAQTWGIPDITALEGTKAA